MSQSVSEGITWDLRAVIPGLLLAASLLVLVLVWVRESLRHFSENPREYFASAFWTFAIVGTGATIFGVDVDTAFTVAGVSAVVIFVWQFFAASL